MNERESKSAASAVDSRPRLNDAPGASAFAVTLMVAVALLLVGGLIFRDFLFGEKLLLYKDVGDDSVIDTYPTLVHLSDYIKHYGFPSWSFCVGMGQSLFYLAGSLVWEPIVWLPRQLIAFALVYQHLLKALVVGLLFFRVLRLRGLDLCASTGGALLLAFSAHMCMGSCWIISADDTVCFTFLLFALEEALVDRRWLYLPIAVALTGLVTPFHLYLSAVLLCFYVPARLVEIYGWKPLPLSRVCMRLAMFAILGVGLGAIVFFGSSYAVLNSPRASRTLPNFAFGPAPSPFQLGSPLYYITNVLRPFSSDLLGTGDAYRGWENYYEAPLSYCGLIALLLSPQAFAAATRRQRILCAIFLILIVIPMVFPWFRYLFWLFQGGYFRAYSLFSVFAILVLSMTAMSRYIERGTINLWLLAVTVAVLLGILYFPAHEMQMLISHELRRTAIVLLISYTALLVIGQIVKRQGIAGWMILGVTAIELIYFDRITVNRPTITKQEWRERIGYNDETVDAISDIKASDHGFFRITKTWGSVEATRPSFNDALVFDYYSTSSYSSFNNLDYIKFLMAVDAIDPGLRPGDSQWSPGLVGHPLLLIFAGEKYVITPDPAWFQAGLGYEFVRPYNDIYLFRNKFSLPFGLIFTHYISEEIFFLLPSPSKELALLHTVVFSGKSVINQSELPSLTLDDLEQQMRATLIPDILSQRRDTAFRIQSFKPTRISGTARLDQNGVLVFQMPFDAGWHSSVDGRSVPTMKVDAGLLGLVLPTGEHAVQLIYRPPFLYIGALVSLVSFTILSFKLWRCRRIPECLASEKAIASVNDSTGDERRRADHSGIDSYPGDL